MLIIIAIIIVIFIILSAFFSGMETGLISIDRLKLEKDAKNISSQKQILDFLKNPDKLFGTTLFGNNISLVIVSSLTILLLDYLHEHENLKISDHTGSLIITGIILLFGEIIPKALYRENPNKLVNRNFAVLKFFNVLLSPFTGIVTKMNTWVSKAFKLKKGKKLIELSREDLSYMVSESETQDGLGVNQKELLEEALEFSEQKAESVMTHRTEIVGFDMNTSIADVVNLAREVGFTRFPVYDDDLDHIIGVLIIYDLLSCADPDKETASDYARQVHFVPETMNIDALLAEMQAKKRSMAIVVDAFGGTAGMITIEDIMEELVGEIEDEYDVAEDDVEVMPDGSYIINGDTEIDFLNDKYELGLPEGDFETMAGLIIDELARIPQKNTTIDLGNYQLKVTKVTKKKIEKIKLTKKN